MITDRDTNLRLGTAYLRMVLDDFDGSQAMAAAAYNAGPAGRAAGAKGRCWSGRLGREHPFNETRDYVKKVLSNAGLLRRPAGPGACPAEARLGPGIGPRDGATPPPTPNLP
jgi:soluble lytic murein transglycosylase